MFWQPLKFSSLRNRDIEGYILETCEDYCCSYRVKHIHIGLLFKTLYVDIGNSNRKVLDICIDKLEINE